MIKLSAESMSSETEVCNDFSIATEQEISTSFMVENSVHLVNDSTLVKNNTKLLDSGDLLSKPVDSNTSEVTVNSSSLFSANESTQDGNGKTNVLASDDLLPESILKSMDTRFCQTESKIKHLEQNMHDSLSGMMKDISNLKDRLSVSNSGDKYMVALQNENEKLKKENEFLVERLNNALFAASDLNTRVKELEKEKSCLVTVIKLVQSSDKLPSDHCETSKASNSNDAEVVQADQNNVVQHSKPESITLSDDESFHHIRPLKRKYKSKKAKNRSK